MFAATKRTISTTFAGALLAISTAYGAVEIKHDPVDDARAGSRIDLSAEITDEERGIELVRAYFKVPDAADYVFTAMQAQGDDENVYTAQLPAPAQDTEAIDYFLLVRNGDGEVVKSQNFTIEVEADEETAAALAALPPRDVVLEPGEFADVDGFHGRLLRLAGDVQVVDADGDAQTPGDAGYVVRESQTIRTGSDGLVVVDFDQDPITVLDNNSRLNVRTPSWFTHLAGKAYFAFQRLLGVAQQERVVANTVALIGIRGTTLISYEETTQGVALKDGAINVASNTDAPMQVTRDGVVSTSDEFLLEPGRVATFDGANVADTAFTPSVIADFARLEAFAAGLLGAAVVAEQSRVDVGTESSNVSAQVTGFDDFITLSTTPPSSVLGISAATSTVVAGAGISATTIGLVAGGAALAVGASGGGSSGGGSDDDDTEPPTGPPVGGSDGFVRVQLDWPANTLTDVDLEVIDPCGFPINCGSICGGSRVQTCQGFSGELDYDAIPPGTLPPENIRWRDTGAPKGTYTVNVTYFFNENTANPPPTPYSVTITRDFGATLVGSFQGQLNFIDEVQTVTSFTYP